jgi:8-oxo-dGTP pyrophosphatase MutT (NUDIX family)
LEEIPGKQIQVSILDEPFVNMSFMPSFFRQLTPSLPAEWPDTQVHPLSVGSKVQSKTGDALVCDSFGTIMQMGPFRSIFLRLAIEIGGKTEEMELHLEFLKRLVMGAVAQYSTLSFAGAFYVTIQETAKFLPTMVANLISLGFAFHHYGASVPDDKGSRKEHVYYKWCSQTLKNMVPAYSTSIEGCAALLLSPDETRILLVKEYGRYGAPGGAIDPGEHLMAAVARELREEVGAVLDDTFAPVFVGGYHWSRARDAAVNDNFHAVAVRARTLAVVLEAAEISAAHWFPVRDLLHSWRALRAAASRQHSAAAWDTVHLDVDGIADLFLVPALVWLETHNCGQGLVCSTAAVDSTAGRIHFLCCPDPADGLANTVNFSLTR